MKSLEEITDCVDKLNKKEKELLKEMDYLTNLDNEINENQKERFSEIENELNDLNIRTNTLYWVLDKNKMGGNYNVR